jgi:hypothetical protein
LTFANGRRSRSSSRCLEWIGENAVVIAELTVFVVIWLFREVESESQLA